MRWGVVLISLAGCGRLGFDPIGDGGPVDGLRDTSDDSTTGRSCFVELGVGDEHACARHEDGSIWCWGRNNQGNLGTGTVGGPNLPPAHVQVGPYRRLTVGAAHNCLIRDDGLVECWGNDGNRALGPNGSGDSGTPVLIPGIATSELYAAGSYACARLGAGFQCWGDSDAAQLGDGVIQDFRAMPALTSDSLASSMALGEDHACAFGVGAIRCWGINNFGQLATPSATSTSACKDSQDAANQPCSPAGVTLPNFSTGVKQLSLGRKHTCAIDVDGDAWCWGNNTSGQLGDNSQTSRSTPMRVTGLAKARAIVAGANHTCAILMDGTASCWGQGTSGELGDGVLAPRLVPVPVSGLTNVVQLALASGGRTTCALGADGVSCWGDNTYEIAGSAMGADVAIPQRMLAACP